MRFQTPKQFLQYADTCWECGNKYNLVILNGNSSNNLLHRFDTSSKSLQDKISDFNWGYKNSWEQNGYTSEQVGNELSYYSFDKTLSLTKIFSINIETNVMYGKIDEIQNTFWGHKLSFNKYCNMSNCKNIYLSESERVFLERKEYKIFPFKMKWEGYLSKMNSVMYFLVNSSTAIDKTLLIKYENEDMRNFTEIYRMPRISMTAFKNITALENKIKTILTFL